MAFHNPVSHFRPWINGMALKQNVPGFFATIPAQPSIPGIGKPSVLNHASLQWKQTRNIKFQHPDSMYSCGLTSNYRS
jgi:hypothetical protein